MSIRSDTSLAALLLTQRLVEGPATPLKASEYWALLALMADPASLLGLGAADVARVAGVPAPMAERISSLLGMATAFAIELERAELSGLHAVASVDDDYPDGLAARLGTRAPPLLYVVGDPARLAGDLLGVVGSRDVDEEGAAAAGAAARRAVANGFGVVSGGAKGVDRLAMQAALDAGGEVVWVVADSLAKTARDIDVRRWITDGRLSVCTPYKPTAPFSVANAMGRNKIIYGLSQATLVVAAAVKTGGTWAGAVEALRLRTVLVLAWTGGAPPAGSASAGSASAGNEELVRLGATAIRSADDIFPLPARPIQPAEAAPEQLTMEV